MAAGQGIVAMSGQNECVMTKDGAIVALGRQVKDDLYVLDMKAVKPIGADLATRQDPSMELHL